MKNVILATALIAMMLSCGCGLSFKQKLEQKMAYINSKPHLSPQVKNSIFESNVCVGMTLDDVKMAWLEDRGWERMHRDDVGNEVWRNSWILLYFEEGKLKDWSKRRCRNPELNPSRGTSLEYIKKAYLKQKRISFGKIPRVFTACRLRRFELQWRDSSGFEVWEDKTEYAGCCGGRIRTYTFLNGKLIDWSDIYFDR